MEHSVVIYIHTLQLLEVEMGSLCSLYQIPNITEIQPNYGPRIGGTLITVTGPHLDAGSSRKVTLNGEPCPIRRWALTITSFTIFHALPI